MNYKKMKFKFAFTLAEVLITLLIVGIIASIVIPGLIQDSKNVESKVAWKKAFSLATQTMKTAASQYEMLINYDDRWTALKSKFNIVKICSGSTFGNCLPAGGITTDSSILSGCGSINLANQAITQVFVANDGMIWLRENSGGTNDSFNIGVDVNGQKGPNQWGKDAFMMLLDSKGRVKPSYCDLTGNSTSYLIN